MAIVVHNSGRLTGTATSGGTSTLTFTTRAVPDRFMVVQIAYRGTAGASGVVWRNQTSGSGDQALTKLGGIPHNGGQNLNVELWGLLAPTASVNVGNQIRITHAAGNTAKFAVNVAVWSGVSQTAPYDGYPSASTEITDQATTRPLGVQGTTLPSPVGETTGLTITTNGVNNLVVSGLAIDAATNTNNFKFTSSAGEDLSQAFMISGGTAATWIRGGLATARGANTASLKWTSYIGTTTSPNWYTGQSGRFYVQCAFTLLHESTNTAPYAILGPNEPIAASGSLTLLRVVSNSDFPTAGAMHEYGTGTLLGPKETGTSTQAYNYVYSAKPDAYSFTASSGAASHPLGNMLRYSPSRGNSSGGAKTIYIPSGVEEDDICLVNYYCEGAGGGGVGTCPTATLTGFTEIATQTRLHTDNTEIRQTLFWKRLTAADSDLTGTKTYLVVNNGVAWFTIGVAYYRGCISTRTPYINSTDDAGNSALPVANNGSSNIPTFPTLTTSAANQTVVMSAATYDNAGGWVPQFGGHQEVEEYYNSYIGDLPCPATATVTGAQTVTHGTLTQGWLTYTITLIPEPSGSNNFARTVSTPHSSTPTALTPSVLASRMVAYKRLSTTDPPQISSTASRRVVYRRLRTDTIGSGTIASTADPVIGYRRTVSTPHSSTPTALTPSVLASRRVAYARAALTPIVAGVLTYSDLISFSKSVVASVNHPRAVATPHSLTPTALSPTSTAVRVVAYKRLASTDPPAITSTVVKRVTYRKVASTDPPAISSTASRQVAYKRTAQTPVVAWTITNNAAIQVINPLSAGWTDMGLYPKYVMIDDINGTYPGCTFLLQAQMQSVLDGQKVYARLYNVTDNTFVANSQIETSVPHTTNQIVRSGSLGLVSGKYYKAQFNKGSSSQMSAIAADVIVRDVA